MKSARSLAVAAALSTAFLALGAEEQPSADAPAHETTLTIFSDKAWDYFSQGELHAAQPVWHPETGILSSSCLEHNDAGQPIYAECLSYLFPDGKTRVHRSREYVIGRPGVHHDTMRVDLAMAPFVFLRMDAAHQEKLVAFEIWDIDAETNQLKSITTRPIHDSSGSEERRTWTEPMPLPQEELAKANADNGFFIKSDAETGFFLHCQHPNLYTAPDGKHMVQTISTANMAASYEFIVYEKQGDGTWVELPTRPGVFTNHAALDFSLEEKGITVIIIDAEYAQALTAFIPYSGAGADTRLHYRTGYSRREQQAGKLKVEFLAVHPLSDAITAQMCGMQNDALQEDSPDTAPAHDLAQMDLSGYQILPYPLTDDTTGQPLTDEQGHRLIRYVVVQAPQAAIQQGVYISSSDIISAQQTSARHHLFLALSPAAAQRMKKLTGSMKHGTSRLAVVINGLVKNTPIVHAPLQGEFIITGLSAEGEAESIANALRKDATLRELRAKLEALPHGAE